MMTESGETPAPLTIAAQGSFAFSDLNNHEIADLIAAFLAEKNLDGEGEPDE